MKGHVALLRAVNVAGYGAVAMSRLVELFAAIGLGGAKTLLASGNVIFDADGIGPALEDRLRAEAIARLGLDTDFLVRSGGEWQALIAANPFPDVARDDPGHLLAYTLKTGARDSAQTRLAGMIAGPEQVRLVGGCLYAVYPEGVGRSKLTLGLIEKSLGVSATGRNWNTVLKIGAALEVQGLR